MRNLGASSHRAREPSLQRLRNSHVIPASIRLDAKRERGLGNRVHVERRGGNGKDRWIDLGHSTTSQTKAGHIGAMFSDGVTREAAPRHRRRHHRSTAHISVRVYAQEPLRYERVQPPCAQPSLDAAEPLRAIHSSPPGAVLPGEVSIEGRTPHRYTADSVSIATYTAELTIDVWMPCGTPVRVR